MSVFLLATAYPRQPYKVIELNVCERKSVRACSHVGGREGERAREKKREREMEEERERESEHDVASKRGCSR